MVMEFEDVAAVSVQMRQVSLAAVPPVVQSYLAVQAPQMMSEHVDPDVEYVWMNVG